MRTLILILCLSTSAVAIAQSNESVTSATVSNILIGNYTPSTYQAATVITDPNVISQGLLSGISADSLTATLYALNSFQNRNMFSDTSSATFGIGAARRWVYNKFVEYSQTSGSRLQVGYLKFTYNPSSYPCTESPSIQTHYNVLAVLPGSQPTNQSLIVIEAHMDSRNNNNCDATGSAPGIGDNATGTAIWSSSSARIMSQYTFRNTIVFSVNTGEEQGLIGAHALAEYLKSQGVLKLIKAVNNNGDVSGGIFCGHTAFRGPAAPTMGISTVSISSDIFTGDVNSPNKQWARYVKLEYKEQAQLSRRCPDGSSDHGKRRPDRAGVETTRHLPISAIRRCVLPRQNEDGDANSDSAGYTDRQHSIRDSLRAGRRVVSSTRIYVNVAYLARNTLVNGNSARHGRIGSRHGGPKRYPLDR